jgi:hypothetical protein
MAPPPTPRGGGAPCPSIWGCPAARTNESFALAWVVTLAMTRKLITLPLRVWFQSARLVTRAAGRVYSLARPAQPPERWGEPRRDPPREARYEPPPRQPPTPQPVRPLHPPFAEQPVDVVREPLHVSEEPELVRESAEPGAEDGAGAAVTVMEPWNGYAHMNAREVIARARRANRAELAAVRLYEARHRSRQTVLAAVDRQLKVGSGSAPA